MLAIRLSQPLRSEVFEAIASEGFWRGCPAALVIQAKDCTGHRPPGRPFKQLLQRDRLPVHILPDPMAFGPGGRFWPGFVGVSLNRVLPIVYATCKTLNDIPQPD